LWVEGGARLDHRAHQRAGLLSAMRRVKITVATHVVVPPSVSQDMSRILNNKARRAAIPGFYKVSTCTLHGVLQSFLFYAFAAGMLYCTCRLEHDGYRLEYGIYWPGLPSPRTSW